MNLYQPIILEGYMTEKIIEIFTDFCTSILKFLIEILKEIVKVLDNNVPGFNTYYNIFVAVASSFIISVVLVRIVSTMLAEADESADVTWANIVMDSIRACMSIPIMLFLQKWLLKYIVIPLVNFMFDQNSKFTAEAIKGTNSVFITPSSKVTMTGFVTILFMLFFVIVLGFFFFKCSIFLVNMGYFHIAIPIVAVSIATKNMDYSREWWQKLLYSNLTLISQVLSLTVCIWGFTHLNKGLLAFMVCIGGGVLVISPPFVLDNLWTTSGMSKTGLRAISQAAMRKIR
ncbi:TPA: conjugal transfer protein TrbL family protein [Streptococcus agalactiae]